ncbi:MAG: glycosyltransferase family 39 protein [Deltaproteobacteria bacterium]|nr:MAG: glycosyltransferase family 39 protein [Deltaproteobacteria bacterium]
MSNHKTQIGPSTGSGCPYLLFVFLLVQRLPSLIVPFWTKDEGFWWAVGKSVANGGKLFVTSVDNKPPLFLGGYALAIQWFGDTYSMMALHALVILGQGLILWVIYQVSRKHWGESIAQATALMYLCLQGSFVSQEILAANSENLMMPLLMLTFYLYDRDAKNIFLFVLMGVLTGIGFFLRQTSVIFFFFYALHEVLNTKSWKHFLKSFLDGLWMLFGFLIVFGLTCLWFFKQGSFDEFWYWTFSITREYVDESLPLNIILWDGFWKTATIMLSQGLVWGLALYALRNDFKKIWSLFFFSMILIVSAGWRFSHHYYLQIFPAAALLAGWALFQRKNKWPLSKTWVSVCLMIPLLGFTGEAVFRCVKDSSGFPRPAIRELGLWLKENKKPNDHLFIWGYYPEIYYYSGLSNGARFVEIHFLTGQIRDSIKSGGLGSRGRLWDWLWSDLKNPPEWFVDNTAFPVSGRYLSPLSQFPDLEKFVLENYTEVKDIHGMKIFHKK